MRNTFIYRELSATVNIASDMKELKNGDLCVQLHEPGDGFYRGTRFDYSGVFAGVQYRGIEFCAPWYERYDPFMHDAVLGPAEEFSPIFLPLCHTEAPQGPSVSHTILKIGVGLLKADSAPYDRFHLYEIIDPGEWTVEQEADTVRFTHIVRGYYKYVKEVRLLGGNSFEISHALTAEVPLEGDVYNHNFFTLGLLSVGPGRCIDFPFHASGDWRAPYDSVALTPQGFRFSRTLQKGESVYMGNIRAKTQGTPYELTIRETGLEGITPTVHVHGSVPIDHCVMWSNHRISCIEPYNTFSIDPGQTHHWSLRYTIDL